MEVPVADEGTEQQTEEQEDGGRSRSEKTENNRPDDTLADSKKCPECGEPVDDVRATCINCGYEYKDEDHENLDAGAEFVTGSQIDDDGNELPDEEPPTEPENPPSDND
jgi:hypothetical protein